MIADYFRRAPRLDVHNGIAFDSVVLHRHGMPLPDENTFDEHVGHQIGLTSELPHKLDFLGSMYTDAPFWKNTFKHSTVKDDGVLDKYLSFDIAVTHTSAGFVERNLIVLESSPRLHDRRASCTGSAARWPRSAIYIDPIKRRAFAEEYQEKSDRLARRVRPGRRARHQPGLRTRRSGSSCTKTSGCRSSKSTSRTPTSRAPTRTRCSTFSEMGVDKRAQNVIHALFGFREAEKILGTNTGHVENGVLVGGPPVHIDGRLRTSWRPGKIDRAVGLVGPREPAPTSPRSCGRCSSPHAGNVFVAADMQAVELRAIAILARDTPLIAAFAAFDAKTGPDVHIMNACGLFNCRPEQVTDEIRNFIKRFVYALSYGAEPPKIYQTLSLLRTDDLRPMFPASRFRRSSGYTTPTGSSTRRSRRGASGALRVARAAVHGDRDPQAQAVLHRGREPDGNGELPDPGRLRRHAKRRHPGHRARLPVRLRSASRARAERARPARGGVRRRGGRGREGDRAERDGEADRGDEIPSRAEVWERLEVGELMRDLRFWWAERVASLLVRVQRALNRMSMALETPVNARLATMRKIRDELQLEKEKRQ